MELEFIIAWISTLDVYKYTVIGNTVYSDLVSSELIRHKQKFKACKVPDVESCGNTDGIYKQLDLIQITKLSNSTLRKLESHLNFDDLKSNQNKYLDTLYNGKLDVSYMNEIVYDQLVHYEKIGDYFLCFSKEKAWISVYLISDFIFESVREPKIITIKDNQVHKDRVDQLSGKVITDILVTDYPRRARYGNLILINPLNLFIEYDPFYVICFVTYCLINQ